ncbi:hypothetical protein JOF29_002412 [Kribbella aluminosa]|uniref:Uncharacterized protein n=1 Tax=Kribbella aluminosa TaxID=416017 RepID=A0ABS4UI86_9ACTN|nr:hypothetical protein [Kribbella aluminosa]MBP2351329.1 hypothetical protein [Kribbella aluminosa]
MWRAYDGIRTIRVRKPQIVYVDPGAAYSTDPSYRVPGVHE